MREIEQIRRCCVDKIHSVDMGLRPAAILDYLLDEFQIGPQIEDIRITSNGAVLIRLSGESRFRVNLQAETRLIHGIHWIADLAGLDGDERGFLLGRVAAIKRPPRDPLLAFPARHTRGRRCTSFSSSWDIPE